VDVARHRLRLAHVEARMYRHHAREARERTHAEMRLHKIPADRAVLAAVDRVAGGAVALEDRLAGRGAVRAASGERGGESRERDGAG
jgi:hypothetical protein